MIKAPISTIIFSLIFLINSSAFSQHSTCNGTRYITDEFTNADVTMGVQFGNNTTVSGTSQDLFMDIYEPTGDLASTRPVIVLAFGGSFLGGTRQDLAQLCEFYAKRGFVAVNFDYRLYDIFGIPSADDYVDAMIKAVSDMKAAVRFLKEDAATSNTYRIDSNLVFVGGLGNGAMVANHLAYLNSTDNISATVTNALSANGSWTGNSSSNIQYSSSVSGVINFSGVVLDTTYITSNEPPLFSVHDDADATMPFEDGNIMIIGFSILSAQGSGLMHQKATSEGISSELITIPVSTDHISYFGAQAATYEDSVRDASCNFLESIICATTNTYSTINITACNSYISPSGSYTWTSSNTYADTITNSAGGDSVMTINLTINSVDLGTTTSGITITADESGATYQWINCGNGNAAIAGETNQVYTATNNGNYAVIVTMNGCSDTSDCVTISNVGLDDLIGANSITISPNPSKDHFTIKGDLLKFATSVQVVSLEGKIVDEFIIENASTLNIAGVEWKSGVYFLILQTIKADVTIKLIKE